MAKNGLTLKALLQLETKQFQQGLNKIKRQLNGFGNFLKSAFAVGSITAFGKQMVNVSKDFEDAMARVKAITNASTEDFEKMSKEARKMGETTRYTASEAAAALENLTRNGMSASQATKALSGVMQLAQANAIGLAEAADIVTNTLNMFGLSVENTTRVNDVLSSTAGNAATNITELYEALVNAAPAAKTLGFNIEEVSAAIGALAQKGVKGSDAGTQLRMSLTKMADPKIIKKMQEMGVQIDEQSMKEEGLLKTVEKLKDAQLSLTDLVKIFSQRGAVGMQQLISAYEDFNRLLDVTTNSVGTTARMFEQGVGSTRKELDTLRSMWEGLLLSIGSKTSGVINGAVKLLQNLVNNFKSVTGTLMNIASVVVPLLVRKVMVLGKTATSTFAAMKAGVVGLKAAMGGWVTIIATLVTWVGTALYGAWAKVNQPIKDAKKNMAEVESSAQKMRTEASALINQLGPDTDQTTLAGIIKRLTEMFPEFADEINNAARIAAQTGNWEKLKSVLNDIVELQALIATREAKQQMWDAQTKWLGSKMYGQGKHPGWNTYTPGLVGPGANKSVKQSGEIYDQLYKQLGKDGEELIKSIFNDIARIITDVGDDVTKGAKIQKLLEDYGVAITKEAAEAYAKNTMDIVGLRPSTTNMVGNAIQSGKDVHAADSTIAVTKIDKAIESFTNLENSLKDNLEKKDSGAQRQMAEQVEKLRGVITENFQYATDAQKEFLQIVSQTYKAQTTTPGGGGGGSTGGSKAKTPKELMNEALTEYTKSAKELKNQLDAGAMTQDEYKQSIDELNEKTWKSITAFDNFKDLLAQLPQELQNTAQDIGETFAKTLTEKAQKQINQQLDKLYKDIFVTEGARDTTYDYMHDAQAGPGQTFSPLQRHAMQGQLDVTLDYADALKSLIDKLKEGIANGDFDLVKDEALKQLQNLEGEFEKAKREATSFQHVLNFSEAQEQLVELQEQLRATTINGVEELARGFGSVNSALFDIIELFDEDVKDSEFYKGLEAMMTVMNSLITIFQTFQSVIEAVGAAKKILAQISKQTAAQEVAADLAVAGAEGTKAAASAGAAAAGAGSAVASVPIVGPVLAIAAIGAVVAAILAAMSKFEGGGIVGGSSTSGDKQIVRANSQEMILTRGQQATLWDMIQSGNFGNSGNVEWRVRGADLIAVIENTQSRRRG